MSTKSVTIDEGIFQTLGKLASKNQLSEEAYIKLILEQHIELVNGPRRNCIGYVVGTNGELKLEILDDSVSTRCRDLNYQQSRAVSHVQVLVHPRNGSQTKWDEAEALLKSVGFTIYYVK